jgi:hypothetical protein
MHRSLAAMVHGLSGVSDRQRIASIRKWDNGRTLRWFGVLTACVMFWAVIAWLGLRLI